MFFWPEQLCELFTEMENTRGKAGLGRKSVFRFNMPISYPGGDIEQTVKYTSLEFKGEVLAEHIIWELSMCVVYIAVKLDEVTWRERVYIEKRSEEPSKEERRDQLDQKLIISFRLRLRNSH